MESSKKKTTTRKTKPPAQDKLVKVQEDKQDKKKMKFYSLSKILSKKAHYNVIIGERSNGKTYAVLLHGLKKFVETGESMGIIRRFAMDLKGNRASAVFSALNDNGEVEKLTHGEYSTIYYYSARWYLARKDEKTMKWVYDKENPFAYAFSISEMEHDKSTSYNSITTILFDEFITRERYFPNEFTLFMNVLSTIIRHRNNVTIFMCGNTVNMYCPYFEEMGLTHISEQKQGIIDVYNYGETDLTVAVEYCANITKKKSNVYFAFDNPHLQMIKSGSWELDIYPHLPYKYLPKNIMFMYFIVFGEHTLQCEIIQVEGDVITYIHKKTSNLHLSKHKVRNENMDVVFTLEHSPKPNYYYSLLQPVDRITEKIIWFFKRQKVFYQSNWVGEIVWNYLRECQHAKLRR